MQADRGRAGDVQRLHAARLGDPHAQASLDAVEFADPCAWVFGNEGAGASAAVQARCAQVVRIPQPGGEESLNVAAAAAICLYASRRGGR